MEEEEEDYIPQVRQRRKVKVHVDTPRQQRIRYQFPSQIQQLKRKVEVIFFFSQATVNESIWLVGLECGVAMTTLAIVYSSTTHSFDETDWKRPIASTRYIE